MGTKLLPRIAPSDPAFSFVWEFEVLLPCARNTMIHDWTTQAGQHTKKKKKAFHGGGVLGKFLFCAHSVKGF